MTMDARPQRFEHTRTLLVDTQRAAERLINALYDERTALRHDDTSSLTGAVGRKKVHLATLEKLDHQRRGLLASCRYSDDLDGMARFIADHDEGGALEMHWSKTLALLAEGREANTANGAIIATQQRQRAEAMRVLRGMPEEPETYGPEGKTETSGQYRALAEV